MTCRCTYAVHRREVTKRLVFAKQKLADVRANQPRRGSVRLRCAAPLILAVLASTRQAEGHQLVRPCHCRHSPCLMFGWIDESGAESGCWARRSPDVMTGKQAIVSALTAAAVAIGGAALTCAGSMTAEASSTRVKQRSRKPRRSRTPAAVGRRTVARTWSTVHGAWHTENGMKVSATLSLPNPLPIVDRGNGESYSNGQVTLKEGSPTDLGIWGGFGSQGAFD